jgi:hypothetical protein
LALFIITGKAKKETEKLQEANFLKGVFFSASLPPANFNSTL